MSILARLARAVRSGAPPPRPRIYRAGPTSAPRPPTPDRIEVRGLGLLDRPWRPTPRGIAYRLFSTERDR